ncbi:MAG: hypothetical protein KDE59_30480 [Anaerolineales bacterium]|nr:hypothetical protein [Anaerolineales bacterium]
MKSSRFESVLDECLTRLDAGESLDKCLQEHPQHAAELNALLGVARSVQALPPPPINRRQYQAGISLMLSRAKARPQPELTGAQRWQQLLGQFFRPALTGGLALAGVAFLAIWVYSLSNRVTTTAATALAEPTVLPATDAAEIAILSETTSAEQALPAELPPPNVTVLEAAAEPTPAPAPTELSLLANPTIALPAIPAPTSAATAGMTGPASSGPAASCNTAYFFEPAPAGCPRFPAQLAEAAVQQFEHGRMIWLPNGDLSGGALIYVLYDNGMYDVFVDEWQSGDVELDETLVVPAGFFQPVRGFGLVWREQPGVKNALGWALAPETGQELTWQDAQPTELEAVRYLQLADATILRLSHAQQAGLWEAVP